METVRDYKDIARIGCIRGGEIRKPVVIWGAGRLGYMLLSEIRVNKLKKVYIYDRSSEKLENLRERITLEQIKHEIDKIVFVIAVEDEKIISKISKDILKYYNRAEIYRYIPKDNIFLNGILSEMGFYNGNERCKALDGSGARQLLEQRIESRQPFLCSRWGSVEGNIVYADLAGLFHKAELFSLKNNAGFYPLDICSIHEFVRCSVKAAKEIDVLIAGCWCARIEELYGLYSPDATLVTSAVLYPFWNDISWTKALSRKKVLVIHPFAKLMERQYVYRDKLFESSDILPDMELIGYQAVQSMNGNSEFESWFAALDKMKNDISKINFDIALLGCGAYGMPLGAFIKSQLRKKAIHLGGSLQILFGIKGKRWEDKNYDYQHQLYNEYWVRPTDDLKPENYKTVEKACYW